MNNFVVAGFHSKAECEKYLQYIDSPRKQQYPSRSTKSKSSRGSPSRPGTVMAESRAEDEEENDDGSLAESEGSKQSNSDDSRCQNDDSVSQKQNNDEGRSESPDENCVNEEKGVGSDKGSVTLEDEQGHEVKDSDEQITDKKDENQTKSPVPPSAPKMKKSGRRPLRVRTSKTKPTDTADVPKKKHGNAKDVYSSKDSNKNSEGSKPKQNSGKKSSSRSQPPESEIPLQEQKGAHSISNDDAKDLAEKNEVRGNDGPTLSQSGTDDPSKGEDGTKPVVNSDSSHLQEPKPKKNVEVHEEPKPKENVELHEDSNPKENVEVHEEPKPKENVEVHEEPKPKENVEVHEDSNPKENVEVHEEPKPKENVEVHEEPKPKENVDVHEESKPKENVEAHEEPKPKENVDVHEEPKPKENVEVHEDSNPKDNVEVHEEPKPKENVEVHEEPKPKENVEVHEEPKPKENVKVHEEPKPKENVELNEDSNPKENVEVHEEPKPKENVEVHEEPKPKENGDVHEESKPKENVDVHEEPKPKENVEVHEESESIETDGISKETPTPNKEAPVSTGMGEKLVADQQSSIESENLNLEEKQEVSSSEAENPVALEDEQTKSAVTDTHGMHSADTKRVEDENSVPNISKPNPVESQEVEKTSNNENLVQSVFDSTQVEETRVSDNKDLIPVVEESLSTPEGHIVDTTKLDQDDNSVTRTDSLNPAEKTENVNDMKHETEAAMEELKLTGDVGNATTDNSRPETEVNNVEVSELTGDVGNTKTDIARPVNEAINVEVSKRTEDDNLVLNTQSANVSSVEETKNIEGTQIVQDSESVEFHSKTSDSKGEDSKQELEETESAKEDKDAATNSQTLHFESGTVASPKPTEEIAKTEIESATSGVSGHSHQKDQDSNTLVGDIIDPKDQDTDVAVAVDSKPSSEDPHPVVQSDGTKPAGSGESNQMDEQLNSTTEDFNSTAEYLKSVDGFKSVEELEYSNQTAEDQNLKTEQLENAGNSNLMDKDLTAKNEDLNLKAEASVLVDESKHQSPDDVVTDQKVDGSVLKTEDPVQETKDPKLKVEDPVQETMDPKLKVEDPVQETKDPKLKVDDPVQETMDPKLKVEDPVQESKDPKLKVEDPVQETMDPKLKVEDPVQETMDPELKTEDPVQEAKDPKLKVEDPVEETMDPKLKSEDPVQETEDPKQKTEDPVQETNDPKLKVEDPDLKVRDPNPMVEDHGKKISDPEIEDSDPKVKGPKLKTGDYEDHVQADKDINSSNGSNPEDIEKLSKEEKLKELPVDTKEVEQDHKGMVDLKSPAGSTLAVQTIEDPTHTGETKGSTEAEDIIQTSLMKEPDQNNVELEQAKQNTLNQMKSEEPDSKTLEGQVAKGPPEDLSQKSKDLEHAETKIKERTNEDPHKSVELEHSDQSIGEHMSEESNVNKDANSEVNVNASRDISDEGLTSSIVEGTKQDVFVETKDMEKTIESRPPSPPKTHTTTENSSNSTFIPHPPSSQKATHDAEINIQKSSVLVDSGDTEKSPGIVKSSDVETNRENLPSTGVLKPHPPSSPKAAMSAEKITDTPSTKPDNLDDAEKADKSKDVDPDPGIGDSNKSTGVLKPHPPSSPKDVGSAEKTTDTPSTKPDNPDESKDVDPDPGLGEGNLHLVRAESPFDLDVPEDTGNNSLTSSRSGSQCSLTSISSMESR